MNFKESSTEYVFCRLFTEGRWPVAGGSVSDGSDRNRSFADIIHSSILKPNSTSNTRQGTKLTNISNNSHYYYHFTTIHAQCSPSAQRQRLSRSSRFDRRWRWPCHHHPVVSQLARPSGLYRRRPQHGSGRVVDTGRLGQWSLR